MRRLAPALLFAATLVATATSGAAADDVEPCKVLKRKQITRVFGQKAGKPVDSLGPTFCQWTLAATDTRAPGQVNVLVEKGKAAKRDYRLGEQLAGAVAEPVDDLGKKAFLSPDTGTLYVLTKGPKLFYVQANVYDVEANRLTDGVKDQLVSLAARAEARL